MVKTPKMHVVDTGMMCALRGITRRRLVGSPALLGSLLESFVYNELRKQALWVEEPVTFHHYRDKDKVEVDIVMEDAAGPSILTPDPVALHPLLAQLVASKGEKEVGSHPARATPTARHFQFWSREHSGATVLQG